MSLDVVQAVAEIVSAVGVVVTLGIWRFKFARACPDPRSPSF